MSSHRLYRWLAVGAMLALPTLAHAQEATLSGTVSDTTGGALPGVTIRAVHEASGNSFEAVTDERGDYRLAVRVGTYKVTAELAGFAPVTRSVELLVGQQGVVNLQMAVSGVQESVTVTGEAPLLDVTQSSLAGNIDPRQLQELPVNGRNWLDLVMLAPGARLNAVTEAPTSSAASNRSGGDFELNVDGQQITDLIKVGGAGQPRFSRDAIAEFEFVSSRFDATLGRSMGVQVNVVTKSGTNVPGGSFSSYFRDDRFDAADFVAKRVLPYQDQQLSGTVGGPIRKDRLHFFANYEYERQPQTLVYTTPFPRFNQDLSVLATEKKGGLRFDAQFSPRNRVVVRGASWRSLTPGGGGGSTTPSSRSTNVKNADQLLVGLTQVLSNRAVNEIKLGYAPYLSDVQIFTKNPRAQFGFNGPSVLLQGLTLGGSSRWPARQGQDFYSIRDDVTYSFTKGGRHTVKTGAEYLYMNVYNVNCVNCEGQLDATGGPIPANVESLFPDLYDPTTWNLAPLSPISKRWVQLFGQIPESIPRHTYGVWVQDDWSLSPRLTLNLGVRYDLELNALANDIKILPFLDGKRPNDKNNASPRGGFSFSLNDRTVIRGGLGLYFGELPNDHDAKLYSQTMTITTLNDARPDFASNPYNGPSPIYESLLARRCTPRLAPGCLRHQISAGQISNGAPIYGPTLAFPYAYQASVGLQRQVASAMGIDVDYVYIGTRNATRDLPINLSFNPATGANYPFSDISKRPFPDWDFVAFTVPGFRANSHSLQTAWTKRMSGGWQASGTYTLSLLKDALPPPLTGFFEPVPFKVAQDFGGEYTLAASDQRHRAVFNAIWQLRYGFQLSGLYFYGSGERFVTLYGVDLRNIGGLFPTEQRLHPDGTIGPRNNLVGKPIHRVDLRLQRRFPLGGRAGIDGMVEVFNVFNHVNYGSYVTTESARNFGQPQQNTNVAYAPRTLQLGFRFAF